MKMNYPKPGGEGIMLSFVADLLKFIAFAKTTKQVEKVRRREKQLHIFFNFSKI